MHVLSVYTNESPTITFSGKICHADRRYLFFSTIFISYIFSIRFLIECRSFVIWVPSGASSLSSRRRHSSELNDDVSNVKRFCNRHYSPAAVARSYFRITSATAQRVYTQDCPTAYYHFTVQTYDDYCLES